VQNVKRKINRILDTGCWMLDVDEIIDDFIPMGRQDGGFLSRGCWMLVVPYIFTRITSFEHLVLAYLIVAEIFQ
jgi:hypothetical protein